MLLFISYFSFFCLGMNFLIWSSDLSTFPPPNHLTQVLMFPILLDHQPLFTEFELFVEAIDAKHELALSGHQQFPVIFVLFCFAFPLAVYLCLQIYHFRLFIWWTHFLAGSVCITFLQEKCSFCWISLSRIDGKTEVFLVGWHERSSVSLTLTLY